MKEQLDSIESARHGVSQESLRVDPAVKLKMETLRAQHAEVLSSARRRVQNTLTPVGYTQLDEFVQQHVKCRIVVYDDSPQ